MEKTKLTKLFLIFSASFGCFVSNAPTYSSETKKLNIIIDLGGVLLDNSKTELLKQIGISAMVHSLYLREKLMDALQKVEPFTETQFIACDEKGNPLPPIFCDMLKGIPSIKILERIEQAISDKTLLHIARVLFTPETFVQTFYLCEGGKQFILDCRNRGFGIYILSNLDGETFDILYERYRDFFDLFDGIIISGKCGLIKPDPAIYSYVLKTFNLDPSECVFIDDQQINIQAATSCGIYGIRCPHRGYFFSKPDFNYVNNELAALQENIALPIPQTVMA